MTENSLLSPVISGVTLKAPSFDETVDEKSVCRLARKSSQTETRGEAASRLLGGLGSRQSISRLRSVASGKSISNEPVRRTTSPDHGLDLNRKKGSVGSKNGELKKQIQALKRQLHKFREERSRERLAASALQENLSNTFSHARLQVSRDQIRNSSKKSRKALPALAVTPRAGDVPSVRPSTGLFKARKKRQLLLNPKPSDFMERLPKKEGTGASKTVILASALPSKSRSRSKGALDPIGACREGSLELKRVKTSVKSLVVNQDPSRAAPDKRGLRASGLKPDESRSREKRLRLGQLRVEEPKVVRQKLTRSPNKNSLKELLEQYQQLKSAGEAGAPRLEPAKLRKLKAKLQLIQDLIDRNLNSGASSIKIGRQESAAITIQRFARGFLVRKFLRRYILETNQTFESFDDLDESTSAKLNRKKQQPGSQALTEKHCKASAPKPEVPALALVSIDSEVNASTIEKQLMGGIKEQQTRPRNEISPQESPKMPKLTKEGKIVANRRTPVIKTEQRDGSNTTLRMDGTVPNGALRGGPKALESVDIVKAGAGVSVQNLRDFFALEYHNWAALDHTLQELNAMVAARGLNDEAVRSVIERINKIAVNNLTSIQKVLNDPTGRHPTDFESGEVGQEANPTHQRLNFVSRAKMENWPNHRVLRSVPRLTIPATPGSVLFDPASQSHKDRFFYTERDVVPEARALSQCQETLSRDVSKTSFELKPQAKGVGDQVLSASSSPHLMGSPKLARAENSCLKSATEIDCTEHPTDSMVGSPSNQSLCVELVIEFLLFDLLDDLFWNQTLSKRLPRLTHPQVEEETVYGIRTNANAVSEYSNILVRFIEDNPAFIWDTRPSQGCGLLLAWRRATPPGAVISASAFIQLESQILDAYRGLGIGEELFDMQRVFHRAIFDCFSEVLQTRLEAVGCHGYLPPHNQLASHLSSARVQTIEASMTLCGVLRNKEDSMMGTSLRRFTDETLELVRRERLDKAVLSEAQQICSQAESGWKVRAKGHELRALIADSIVLALFEDLARFLIC